MPAPTLWEGILVAISVVALGYLLWDAGYFRHVGLARPAKDNEWLKDAAFYMVRKRWPKEGEALFDDPPTGEAERTSAALQAFRQRAFDGDIKVWGRPRPRTPIVDENRVLEPIKSEQWAAYSIEATDLMKEDPREIGTIRVMFEHDDGSFWCLRCNRQQIEDWWAPRINVRLRWPWEVTRH
jgi:hypothetical protein